MTTTPRARAPLSAAGLAVLAAAVAVGAAAPASAAPTPRAVRTHFVAPVLPLTDELALEVVALTNEARVQAGCAPLALADQLVTTALRHSADMAETARMSHVGADGSSPRTRLAGLGVRPRLAAENVAAGAFTPRGLVDAWLASPGHRRNILDCDLDYVGVARADVAGGAYWTQALAGV
ncbi:CAP domain-containing protein [Kineococcus sp. R8]|uniref:CAP domain-containing protein n=1 Tax=Kineococcus siccus TaxID=2696567 RepID=UPI001412AFE7|nr:CAP domain-containing protein [Kineococcus siccus]NAZ83501.1 CAP domain-containing protein [Kineococcus siccus]